MSKKLNIVSSYILICILFLVSFCLNSKKCLSETKGLVYHVKINEEINLNLVPFLERIVKEADKKGINAIILEINTFGGRVDAAIQIRDALINAKTLTIAYINERAISAGALISLACKKIVMAPGATIGAATPVTMNPFTRQINTASEKFISYFRNEMKATAERNGRPVQIAEAMVDPDVEIEGVIKKGKLLTLTTSEAIYNNLADMEISNGLKDILSAFQLKQSIIVNQKMNWAEKSLAILTNALISMLLLTIGIIALLIEFRAPTWGVAGSIGLICLILFFWGHWALHLVGWEEIILIFIGTILLLIEIFFIPGFGVTGISGILVISVALILSLVGNNPTLQEILNALSHLSIAFICVFIFLIIFARSFLKTKAVQRFVLHTQTKSKSNIKLGSGAQGEPSLIKTDQENNTCKDYKDYFVGKEGMAFTNLRPAGKGIFDKERLNVVTEGDFLEKGTPIRIIRIEGSNIIVQKIKENRRV